ncbi:MAG: LysR substrate-binding domain-containing protein [Pseudomonadota bacterium]
MDITLRQLRYFLALSRTGHFGRAADACAVSQPALSVQIKELEATLGGALVDRSARGFALTPLGHEIAEQAGRVSAEAEALVAIARARRGLEGVFSLGLIPTIAPYLLPAALDLIRRRLPLLDLRVREATTDELLSELQEGRLDACVIAAPAGRDDLDDRFLLEDQFLLAVHGREAQDLGLVDGQIKVEQVAEMRLLLLDEGHCLRDQALSFCQMTARDATTQLGASSMATLLRLVAGGYGVTLTPEMAFDEVKAQRPLKLLSLASPQPSRQIHFVTKAMRDGSAPYGPLAEVLAEAAAVRQAEAQNMRTIDNV